MSLLDRWDRLSPPSRGAGRTIRRLGIGLVTLISTVAVAGVSFRLHLNLATAGSLELLAVVLVALRWGFEQATVVSVVGVLCLDYFFTAPILQLSVADPQNYVSLFTLELTALLVSGLSTKVRLHAVEAEKQRIRSTKLYELSRAILLIDARSSVTEQLASLIREIIGVQDAFFWVVESSPVAPGDEPLMGSPAHLIFESGVDSDVLEQGIANRILRLGATRIGAVVLVGDHSDPLLANAVASLAAIAIERAHALQREGRAAAERNVEQLRTAVLDGLAHGFKTPLTAIQTASSGLIAIGQLSPPQLELVSIIDERTSMLNQLCTRLLQTAALESREVRLRRQPSSMSELVSHVISQQEEEVRSRISIDVPDQLTQVDIDVQMVELAILQLIDNAAKYSDVGSSIRVAVQQLAEQTLVIVENSGPAILPSDQERIFQRFYRGAKGSHGPTGTGLGLSIVKKTAEAHGGDVQVKCIAGLTRFTFTLQHTWKAR